MKKFFLEEEESLTLPFFPSIISQPSMGGVLQTIKFLSAAGGVGLCLKGMDKLAQRIDEYVSLEGREEEDETKEERKTQTTHSSALFSPLNWICFALLSTPVLRVESDACARVVASRIEEKKKEERGGFYRRKNNRRRRRPRSPPFDLDPCPFLHAHSITKPPPSNVKLTGDARRDRPRSSSRRPRRW